MIPILLLGDSLLANYDWQKRLPDCTVFNLAIPNQAVSALSSTIPTITEQVAKIKLIVVMCGSSELLAGNNEFPATLKEIIIQLQKSYPRAEIILNGLFPMELPLSPYNAVIEMNKKLATTATQTGSCFLDIQKKLSAFPGPIFLDDGFHITEEACDLWARTLREYIAFLIEDD